MAKRIYLALAIHNHQPVGNLKAVFEQGYREAYEPLIAALERHPHVRLALHYSGPLRDWLAEHQPQMLARIRTLVLNGQVEMMTGGYYEPILASIPDADKLGQIHKLQETVLADFGVRTSGLWLAERIWEPHLPLVLARAGVEYTIVDDTHFKYVGLEDADLFGYYVTEEQGYALRIFGTSKYLRYVIPWASVEEIVDYLRSEATEEGIKVAVMGDDGEKLGLWPGTHAHVWQKGWMDRFFEALRRNSDWLQIVTPGEYARRFPSLGRVYLPTASYDEMGEWALPAQQSWEITHLKHRLQEARESEILRFVRGGFWRSFLAKYPEINTMHKKMLLVSDKVWALEPSPERSQALDALWAGQCNCPYWHGIFGGAYLLHIRTANYERLLTAENMADARAHTSSEWAEWREMDLDRDGLAEVLLSGDGVNLYFDPADGGSCFEWDWRARSYNLANVMSRRPEAYHRDLTMAAAEGKVIPAGVPMERVETIHTRLVRVKEPGLERRLYYDWFRHASLVDHFLHPGTTVEDVYRAQFGEIGDFVSQPYGYTVTQTADSLALVLSRDGHVWQGDCFCPLRVEKQVHIRPGSPGVEAHYTLTNTSPLALTPHFAVETVWSLLGGEGPTASATVPGLAPFGLSEPIATPPAEELGLRLGWLKMRIGLYFSRPAELWLLPLDTISSSEGGFERIYQGTCLFACWPLELPPGGSWSVALRCEPVTTP
jgi:alpha-amylase